MAISEAVDCDLFGAVSDLKPMLREWGARSESQRDLPPEAVDALRERGYFRIWTPKALGGMELHPTEGIRLFEALARVDSAAGWVVANAAVITTFCQVLSDDALSEIFVHPDTIVAGGWFPPGAATPVEGGFRVSSQCAFGSLSRHADWLTGMAVILDERGAPQLLPDGRPKLLLVFVPAGDAEIVDNWDTLGMRGTGSHDMRLADVFVPAHRTFPLGPFDPPGSAFQGPLYRFHMWLGGPEIAAVALGVAGAAITDFTALAERKVPSYTEQLMADRPVVQDRLARATAGLAAARAYLHSSVDEAFDEFSRGGAPSPVALSPVQLASCHAVESAQRAVDLLHAVAGTSGIRVAHPLERHFRDIHTIAQHTLSSAARFESVGQLLLGRQSNWAFFYL